MRKYCKTVENESELIISVLGPGKIEAYLMAARRFQLLYLIADIWQAKIAQYAECENDLLLCKALRGLCKPALLVKTMSFKICRCFIMGLLKARHRTETT